MLTTTLAQAVVEFVAKGVEQAESRMRKMLDLFKSMSSQAGRAADAVSKSFRGMAIAASAFFGSFSSAAMQGTSEGERFSTAVELASRAIGDMFAPAIRIATTLLSKLTAFVLSIDRGWRMWAGTIIAAVAAISSFVAIAAPMLSILTPMLAVLGAMASPIGLIVFGIGAIGTAMLKASGVFIDWEEVAVSVVNAVLTAWELAEDGWSALMEVMYSAWEQSGQVALQLFTEAWELADSIVTPVVEWLTEAVANFFGIAMEDGVSFGEVLGGIYEAWADLITPIEMLVKWIKDMLKPVWDWCVDAFMLGAKTIGGWFTWIGDKLGMVASKIKFTWKDTIKLFADIFLGAVLLVAQGLNLLASGFTKTIGFIVDKLAWVAEKTGVLGKATIEEMRKFGKTMDNFQLIDTDKLTKSLGGYSNAVGEQLDQNAKDAQVVAGKVDKFMGEMSDGLNNRLAGNERRARAIVGRVSGWMKGAKDEVGGGGFKRTMDISFEGLSSTFDRIQKSLANVSGAGVSIDQAQLNELQAINKNMQVVAGDMSAIRDTVPAVV